jgi:hypothetical protein
MGSDAWAAALLFLVAGVDCKRGRLLGEDVLWVFVSVARLRFREFFGGGLGGLGGTRWIQSRSAGGEGDMGTTERTVREVHAPPMSQ